jgi:putative transposase
MRENQLIARQKRRFKRTTYSGQAWRVSPNLVAQNFTADAPERKWGADISYILTAQRWLYLAVILDLFSRRVVGWATGDRLKRDLEVEALRRALVARNPAPGLVHHSDRGSQYCSVDYQALLRKRGILISMSGRGTRYGHSMVLPRENSPLDYFLILLTFFKTIKSELIWPVA